VLEYLFNNAGTVLLQLLRVLFDDGEGVVESRQSTAYLVVDPRDLTTQDLHVTFLAVSTHFLVAMAARCAVVLL